MVFLRQDLQSCSSKANKGRLTIAATGAREASFSMLSRCAVRARLRGALRRAGVLRNAQHRFYDQG